MNYIQLAIQFLIQYAPAIMLADDVTSLKRIVKIISQYYKKNITVTYGMTRIVIVTNDFVIKMDYGTHSSEWGDCENEYNFYQFAKTEGFDYLFARVDKYSVQGKTFYIMPFIDKVGTANEEIEEYTDVFEQLWLHQHVTDLHYNNFGFNEDGMPIIIDYACVTSMEHYSFEDDDIW